MSGGFWAGAVPPWAWPVGGCLLILAVLLGAWYGYGRGQNHAAEDQAMEREQFGPRIGLVRDRRLLERAWARLPEPEDAWRAHEDQALTLANDGCVGPSSPEQAGQHLKDPIGPSAITTGEIQAITTETDAMVARWKTDNDLWMAEHGLSDT